MKKYFFLCGFCTLLSDTLVAQNLNVITEVNGGQDKKAVLWNGKYHSLEGGDVKYSFSLSGIPQTDTIDANHIVSFTYKYENGEEVSGEWDNKKVIKRSLSESINGERTFVAKLCYYRGAFENYTVIGRNDEDTEDIAITKTRWNPKASLVNLESSGIPVILYNKIKEPTFTEKTNYYLLPNKEIILSVQSYSGGGNWVFQWNGNDGTDSYKYTSPSAANKQEILATVKNMAPDGKTEWGSYTKTYTVTTYSAPSVSVSGPTNTVWKKNDGTLTWIVSPVGGNTSGWKYSWNNNGSAISGNKVSFDLSAASGTKQSRVMSLTATNVAPDGTELYVNSEYSFTYDVYSIPEYSLENSKTVDIYANESANILNTYNAASGYPSGWTTTFNGALNLINKQEGGSFIFTPSNPSISSVESKAVNLTLKNTAVGASDNIWVNESRTYTFRVYPVPSAVISSTYTWNTPSGTVSENQSLTVNQSKTSASGSVENAIVGDKIQIPVPSFSGDKNTWKWYVNDVLQSNTTAYSYTYTASDASSTGKIKTFVVKVVNQLDNRTGGYTASATYTAKVYTTPVYSLQHSKTIDIYANESTSVANSYDESTGYADGWNVSFDGNTELTSVDADGISFNLTPANSSITSMETKTVSVTLTNKSVDRSITNMKDAQTYTFRIYPVPSAVVSSTYTWNTPSETVSETQTLTIDQTVTSASGSVENAVVGDKIQIPVPTFSGDKNTWKWYVNDVLQSNTTAYSYTYTASDASSTGKIKTFVVKVVNQLANRTGGYTATATYTAKVYPTPVTSLQPSKTIDIYANESTSVISSYDKSTGYVGGWNVSFDGNTELISEDADGISFTFTPDDSSISSMVTKTVTVTLTNKSVDRSIMNFKDTQTYTFRIYPVPAVDVACTNTWHTVTGDVSDTRSENLNQSAVAVSSQKENSRVGDVVTIPVPQFNGVKSTWSWYVNNVKQSNSSAYTYTYTSADASSNGAYHDFVVKVVNKLANRSESFIATYTITDNVWSTPVYSLQNDKTIDIYANESFLLENSYTKSSAYTKGWDVEFTGDVDLVAKQSNGISFKLIPDDSSITSMVTKKVTVRLTNNTTGDRSLLWLDEQQTYTFRIYPVPVAVISESTTWNTLDGSSVSDLSSTLDQTNTSKTSTGKNVLIGDKIQIPVPSFTGDINTWKWYVNDVLQSNTAVYTYTYTNEDASEDGKDKTFLVRVVNKLENRNQSFSASQSTSYKVWNKPSFTLSDEIIETFGGETEGFALTTNGGYKDGWVTSWTDSAGKTYTAEQMAALQFNPSSKTDYKFNVLVTNTCEGKLRYSQTKEVVLSVWPKPSSSLKVSLKKNPDIRYASDDTKVSVECFDEDALTIDYTVDGGFINDGTTWSYEVVNVKDTFVGNNKNGNDTYSAKVNSGNSSKETIKVRIKNTYNGTHTTSKTVWFDKTYDIDITAWRRASIVKNAIPYTDYVGGETVDFTVLQNYGYPSDWTYTWTDEEGNIIPGQSKNNYEYTASYNGVIPDQTDINNIEKHAFTLHAVNKIGDNVGYDEYLSFPQITIWPTPTVKKVDLSLTNKSIDYGTIDEVANIELYSGDNIKVAAQLNGGVLNKNCWTYTLTGAGDSKVVTNDKSFANSSIVPQSTSGSKDNEYTLTITNNPDSKRTWFSKTFLIKTKTWALPAIEEVLEDSVSRSWANGDVVDVYAGGYEANKLNFIVKKDEGNETGWNYEWSEDGNIKSNTLENWTYVPESSSAYTDKEFKVHVTNSIGNNVALDETKTYHARIWKKASMPDHYVITDNNQERTMTNGYLSIRSGNTINVKRDNENFGYNESGSKSFRYSWNINGESIVKEESEWSSPIEYSDANPVEKGIESYVLGLKVDHLGPYGNNWDGQPYYEQIIKIYNKPHTPTELKKNGNGTSGTMIAITDLSDANLEAYDYYLVFGYEKPDGNIVEKPMLLQSNPGAVRYDTRFTSAEVNNTSYKFFVYAQWCYNDGTTTTSGKRYMNGVDDKWDGSDYSGNGGSIGMARNHQTVTDIELVDASLNGIEHIYTIDGKPVDELVKGINIIRYKDGNVKKVNVRK